AALLAVALWQFGTAAYIHLKAGFAQYLIAAAWEKSRGGAQAVKPWPWADTWPVARLTVPARGIDLYVLAGASGRTLAFGPGHLGGSAAPGGTGNALISAHRDTHFAFLEHLAPGDEVCIETPGGAQYRYRVVHTAVVHQSDRGVMRDHGDKRLTLVTCYPFRAIDPGGPLRYVVTAIEV
ncbi:MAG: class GN sortase, partial [Burkholderiales bacterium]|nr:class GN sortase [Burkholderiales bacterium]